MSVENTPFTQITSAPKRLVLAPREDEPQRRRFRLPGRRRPRRPKPRIRKLRLFLIFITFITLALISAVFGALMSVASDLPELKPTAVKNANVDSYLYDDTGQPIGVLAPPGQAVVDNWSQIGNTMVHAIVAVEDRRYWTDPGFDLKGLIRAALSDLTGGQHEGASTIAEQYVKVKMSEEDHRTIFEKLREAALAFQLVHRWKRTEILTDYLNSIYFGNGAVGIEDAARVYFGQELGYNPNDPGTGGCGDATVQHPNIPKCSKELQPYQAALLAGMVANPTAFDPLLHPQAARERRNTVLRDMLDQHYITRGQYDVAQNRPLPQAANIQQPTEPAKAPYFAAWVRPQIIRALEAEGLPENRAVYDAYYGGLKIKLTLNLQMQQAAQNAIDAEFPPGVNGPTASLVAIDNNTGEVRAMVSGNGDYQQNPFNLAVDGQRQPGSSFKLFTLAAALTSGDFGPYSIINSHGPLDIPFTVRHEPLQHFIVHNFGNVYSGDISLATATAESDNSVFAQVGMTVGPKKIAQFAHNMGIRGAVSTNPSMILGGLKVGVSALDMAHAYETVATGGLQVYNKVLGDIHGGPIGIHSIAGCQQCHSDGLIVNQPTRQRELSPEVAQTIQDLLEGVVAPGGTGTEAAIPGVVVAGKTGTTSNYVDAWFVGWTQKMTVAVWVGYPNSAVPMLTNWDGGPVEGGTYPAVIWRNFMESALQIMADQASGHQTTTTTPITTGSGSGTVSTTALTTTQATTSTTATTQATTPTTATTPAGGQTGGAGTAGAGATNGGAAATGTAGGGANNGAAGAATGTASPGTGAAAGAGATSGSAGSASGTASAGSASSAGTPSAGTPSTGNTGAAGGGTTGGSSSATGGAGLGGGAG